MTVSRRSLALALLVLSLAPFHRLLEDRPTGPFGEASVRLASANLASGWWGLVLVGAVGLGLAVLTPGERVRRALVRVGDVLARPSAAGWATAMAGTAFVLSAVLSRWLFLGYPTLVDEMASLIHARFMAEGRLAGSPPGPAAAWHVSNTFFTDRGWLSQYPPFHPALLAAGLKIGAVWLVGPALTALLAGASVPVADRLLGERRRTARLGTLLLALSPFLLFLGAGYLSHVSAAAFAAVTLLALLLTRDGDWRWSLLAGVATGAMVTSRPWTGLTLAAAFTIGVWLVRPPVPRGRRLAWTLKRLGGAVAGGVPFAAGIAAFNARFFGSPLRLGYSVAYGPSHDLGFHPDPWGNRYGPVEALAYTSTDLIGLGAHLLETPIPAVAVAAAGLLVASRIDWGEGLLWTWALVPVAANAFYWHHGSHMGPRMLYEAAPAWAILVAVAVVRLSSPPKRTAPVPPARDGTEGLAVRIQPRDVLLWAFVLSVPIAAFWLAPRRAASYAWDEETLSRIQAPEHRGESSLVFVHTGWTERLSARLYAEGMTLDSVETVLRRNDVCALERYARAREVAAVEYEGPALDLEPLSGTPPHLRGVAVAPGYHVWVDPSRPFSPDCAREARADRLGVLALAPLIWQGDLPGAPRGGAMFVRDLGPARNREVLEAFPERSAWLLVPREPGAPPRLVPYREGMERLWGTADAPG